jgi:NADH-quinone oxidoreductase subunit E
MLTEEDRREIEEEIRHSSRKDAACIEALKVVQRRRGWVSDEDVRDVALFLEMSPAEVDSVATFYNLIYRRPVGRHVILVCDSVSCWLLGYNDLLERLRQKLGIGFGETSADGMFTVLPVPCLGACDRAPAVMIDATLNTNLNPEKLDALLGEIRAKEA